MFCKSLFHTPHNAADALTLLARICLLLFPPLLMIGSAGAEVAVSVTAVLFLLHSALTRNWAWLREKWLLCFAALWLYMIVRGLFAEQPHEALHRSLPFIRYFVFAAALAAWVMRDAQMRRCFLLSLTVIVSFMMADGLLQFCIGHDLLGRSLLRDPQGHIRLTGPFGQTKPILGIMLAWLTFPVSLHLLLTEEGKFNTGKKRVIGIGFALSVLCMVALSGERMALWLTLLGWGIALLLLRINKRLLAGILVAGVLALGALSVAVPSLFERQVTATLTTFAHWQESPYGKLMASDMNLAMRNPVFGLGANHFRIACPSLYPNADKDFLAGVCNIHPHNIFMEWLIEEGVIGLGLFLLAITCIACRCHKVWPVIGSNPLFIGWCIAFALRIWPIGSTTGFFSNWGAPPFWLALGMVLAYSSKVPEGKTANDSSVITL